MNRRELLKAAAILPLSQTALSHAAFAQSPYPSRNITMIVPFPAGGQADLAARPVALALEKILGKPVHRRQPRRRGRRFGRQCRGGARRARRPHLADDAVVAGHAA